MVVSDGMEQCFIHPSPTKNFSQSLSFHFVFNFFLVTKITSFCAIYKFNFFSRGGSFGYQENYFAKKKFFCLARDGTFGYQKNYFAKFFFLSCEGWNIWLTEKLFCEKIFLRGMDHLVTRKIILQKKNFLSCEGWIIWLTEKLFCKKIIFLSCGGWNIWLPGKLFCKRNFFLSYGGWSIWLPEKLFHFIVTKYKILNFILNDKKEK